MVRKIFFCSEFPVIPERWWRKEKEEKQLRNFLVTQANTKSVLLVWRHALAGWFLSCKHGTKLQVKAKATYLWEINLRKMKMHNHYMMEKLGNTPKVLHQGPNQLRINWGRRIRYRTRFTFKAIVNLFSYWKIRS